MALYPRALDLLSSCLENSTDPAPAISRLMLLCPVLPDPSTIHKSPLLHELNSIGITDLATWNSQYSMDARSSACLLTISGAQQTPATFLYLQILSLNYRDPASNRLDPIFIASLCKAICRAESDISTTHVIRSTLSSALSALNLPVLLGVLQALCELPIFSQSELLREPLLSALTLARDQAVHLAASRHRRRRHQWSQVQIRSIRAISQQLQSCLNDDAVLRQSLYKQALGVLGFKDATDWRITPSAPISVDMYAACAQICVSCALSQADLAPDLLHCLMKLLRVSCRANVENLPSSSCKAVFTQMLAGIVRLAIHDHSLIGTAVDQLKALLESPSLQQHSDYEDLHESVSSALADILKAELSIPGRQFKDMIARKLVFSLDHNLLVAPNDQEESTMTDQSLLLLLGRVTSMVNNPKLTGHVLPMLMNRFTNSPKLLHIVIPHLTNIALVSEPRVFQDVVALLTSIYSKPFIPDNKWNRKEIPDALLYLATNVTVPDLRISLLKSLLKLFKVLGRQIQERMEQSALHNSSSMAGVLGFLLPALAALMIPSDPLSSPGALSDGALIARGMASVVHRHQSLAVMSPWDHQSEPLPKPVTAFDSPEADVKWFRTLWNYLVLYRFTDANSGTFWPPAWASAVQTIAAHSPALALSLSGPQHDVSLFAETGISQVCVGELRARLCSLYPTSASVSSVMAIGALTYVLAVDALESSRAISGSATLIFVYLHDQTIAPVSKIIDTVVDRVFQLYLDAMASLPPDSFRRHNLESHVIFLFAQLCSRHQRVANKAALCLKEIVSRFPFLQWSKRCLATLFELVSALQETTNDIDLIGPPSTEPKQGARFIIDLPDDIKSRSVILAHVQKLLTRWLENATFTVPAHMCSILQLFVQEWHDRNLVSPSYGIYTLLRHLLSGKRQGLLSLPSELDPTIASFTHALTARQRYLGDIRGRFFAFCQRTTNIQPFGFVMAAELLSEFHSVLGKYRQGDKDQEPLFRRCMYLSAGLLVWSVTPAAAEDHAACLHSPLPLASHKAVDPRELMHLLCMAPVYMFTESSVACAIQIWSWIFAVSHAFSVGLLVTMKSAWSYTVETRLGLFAVPPSSKAAQFSGCLFTRLSSAYHSDRNLTAPHDAWISFLLDRFDTIADCSAGSCRAVQVMLHKALSRPDFISLAPTAFSARFRMLLLGLRMVHSGQSQELLRDRVMSAAFAWFTDGPRWPQHETFAQVIRDGHTIVSFIEAIRRDMSSPAPPVQLSTVNAAAAAAASVSSRHGALMEAAVSVHGSVPQPSVMRSARPATDPTEALTLPGSDDANCNVPDADFGLQPDVGDAVTVGVRSLRAHVDLLVLLMSHELHRIVAWHNPRRHPDKMLRDENLYAHNLTTGVTQDDWRRYFSTAWQVDPHLAYRLAQRFPYVFVLRQLIRSKVRSQPLAFRSIGEAVRLLCNSRNCKAESPILKHINLYESCSLPMALRLLCRPYSSNRIANQFTMRSLAQHAHTGVIFYMPEMIQALRHDVYGSLATFLLTAGTQSPHLAHQLIWALQTESVLDDTRRRTSDDGLPNICSALERDVISSFTPEAAAFFHAEFSFFGQITRLSSDLLVVPKAQKEERRNRLQSELARIRNDTLKTSSYPLYLPTDHTAQVIDIVVDTAKPLQSAARVPFLVEFLVQNERHEVESDDDQDISVSTGKSDKIFTKQVIFKAGDDCRQDCLALQFIRLCKDILDSVGLPLFLFPYLVIPNRTGQSRDLGGVIECVRQSASRDELGKSNGLSLRDYFLSKYGRPESSSFKQAQRNFTLSMAGYAVCCYLLQVKDRHNGNILLDDAGHVIHIDFGFIFDISPAKDIKFESAGFKLTLEMVEVMDNVDSDMWNWFVDLCARGYLAVRAHRDDFLALTDVMVDSALGCFKPDSVRNLKLRFVPEKNERDAAQHMVGVVMDSYNKFTTNTYDSIQYLQQGIYYYAGQPS
uniref:1-phosphatidylinositol 4-kinase n=1 Tax=Spongospora subterranea TaxID=70186 RepID=A0A0H5QH78_9EUKA|eukprot:CRZ01318.1 hypothetical protein [Spongospora subterranea]